MKVKVLFFASVREAAGRGELPLQIGDGADIRSLLDRPEMAALRPHLSSARFALNEEFAPLDARLSDGDVVAVIPPVSGG